MNFFEEASLRLKQQLRVSTDRAAAAELGLTPRQWAGRKKEGNFPETELYALQAKRPDLSIDVNYVLTGIDTATRHARVRHARGAEQARAALRGDLAAPAEDHVVNDSGAAQARYALHEAGGISDASALANQLALIEAFRRCDADDQAAVLRITRGLASLQKANDR